MKNNNSNFVLRISTTVQAITICRTHQWHYAKMRNCKIYRKYNYVLLSHITFGFIIFILHRRYERFSFKYLIFYIILNEENFFLPK